MRIKPYPLENAINSSLEAQKIYFKQFGKKLNLKPFIINFYMNDEAIISSIGWKGYDNDDKKEKIVMALKLPLEVVNDSQKTEYIPLNNGDTIIINGTIITAEEREQTTWLMQLPYITSEKYAISIANTLTGRDNSNLFWQLASGFHDEEPSCCIWLGLCPTDPDKSMVFPVFAEDKDLLEEINDIKPASIPSNLMINDCIYHYVFNKEDNCTELEFICTSPQGLPS